MRETSDILRFQKIHDAITRDLQSVSNALWFLYSSEYLANIREVMVDYLA